MSRNVPQTLNPEDYRDALLYLKESYADSFIRNFVLDLMHQFYLHRQESHTENSGRLLQMLKQTEIANYLLYQNALALFEEQQRSQPAIAEASAPAESKEPSQSKNSKPDRQDDDNDDALLTSNTPSELEPLPKPVEPNLWITTRDEIARINSQIQELAPNRQQVKTLSLIADFKNLYMLARNIAGEYSKEKSKFMGGKTTQLGGSIYRMVTAGNYSDIKLAAHISELNATQSTFSGLLNTLQQRFEKEDETKHGLEREVGQLNETVKGLQGEMGGLREANDRLNQTLHEMTLDFTQMIGDVTLNQSRMLNETLDQSFGSMRSTRLFDQNSVYNKARNFIESRTDNDNKRIVCINAISQSLSRSTTGITARTSLTELLVALLTPRDNKDQSADTTIKDWLSTHRKDITTILAQVLETHQELPPFCLNEQDTGAWKDARKNPYDVYLKSVSNCFLNGVVLPQNQDLMKQFDRMRPCKQKAETMENGSAAQNPQNLVPNQ